MSATSRDHFAVVGDHAAGGAAKLELDRDICKFMIIGNSDCRIIDTW
jgi:hypothetical protein